MTHSDKLLTPTPPAPGELVFYFILFFKHAPLFFSPRQKEKALGDAEWGKQKESATQLIGDIDGPPESVKTQNQEAAFPPLHSLAFVEEPSPHPKTCGQYISRLYFKSVGFIK